MRDRRYRAAAACVAVLVSVSALSACTGPRHNEANWQNPNVAKEDWSLDIGECRRFARQEVRRAAGPAAMSPPSDNIGGGVQEYNRKMTAYDLSRFEEKTFAACMRTKGYSPIVQE